MTNTKISLIERIKRWKKSNIVFIAFLILAIYSIHSTNPSYGIGPTIVVLVILSIPYAIMMIIIDMVTSKSSEVLDQRASIKKAQKEAENKEERQKVENIDLDL